MVGCMRSLIDCNVHLWDQTSNPVFWLTDRTLVRDMLGDYDSLPDVYTLADYQHEVAGHHVRGIVWSDAGADDPIAAAGWVQSQSDELDVPVALVTLGDPADPAFVDLVECFRALPLARSVRVRLVPALAHGGGERRLLEDDGAMANLELLAKHGLVATVEGMGDQLGVVADLARALPALRIVVDHFGWPENPSEAALAAHRERLSAVASASNTATRIDAIGTVFGDWTTDQIRPWLRAAIDVVRPANRAPAVRLRAALRRLPRRLLRSHGRRSRRAVRSDRRAVVRHPRLAAIRVERSPGHGWSGSLSRDARPLQRAQPRPTVRGRRPGARGVRSTT
jgi:predicted TIM-barrel fold metal-dependent hydrolase